LNACRASTSDARSPRGGTSRCAGRNVWLSSSHHGILTGHTPVVTTLLHVCNNCTMTL